MAHCGTINKTSLLPHTFFQKCYYFENGVHLRGDITQISLTHFHGSHFSLIRGVAGAYGRKISNESKAHPHPPNHEPEGGPNALTIGSGERLEVTAEKMSTPQLDYCDN